MLFYIGHSRQPAIQQSTLNWKKLPSLGSWPLRVHHRLPGFTLYQCHHLVNLSPARWWGTCKGQDPPEGIFSILGWIVSWLLAVTNSIKFHKKINSTFNDTWPSNVGNHWDLLIQVAKWKQDRRTRTGQDKTMHATLFVSLLHFVLFLALFYHTLCLFAIFSLLFVSCHVLLDSNLVCNEPQSAMRLFEIVFSTVSAVIFSIV